MGELKEPVLAGPVERVIPTVSVEDLKPHVGPIPIRGEGFVSAFREVELATEIGGRIVELHPAIDSRGSFKKGDVLVKLDARAPQAALDRAKADLQATKARLDLNETQLSRSQKLLDRGVITEDRHDQLLSENAQLGATFNALNAAVESAEVQLQYATVRALFDGAVLEQEAELGAVISAGEPIARLFTDRQLEVTVAVNETDAALIPGLFNGAGANGEVTARFAGRKFSWSARVDRVDQALDQRTRTLGVTLSFTGRVDDSDTDFSEDLPSGLPPALLNSFVEVKIDGAALGDVYRVPTTAVRNGGSIWLADNDKLIVEPVDVVHVDGEESFLRFKSEPAATRIVTSSLQFAVPGMEIEVISASDQTASLGG